MNHPNLITIIIKETSWHLSKEGSLLKYNIYALKIYVTISGLNEGFDTLKIKNLALEFVLLTIFQFIIVL